MEMKVKKVNVLGMELERHIYKSCVADLGIGNNWATLYSINSKKRGKGHATALLRQAKIYYEMKRKVFGGTVALNEKMRKIYQKLKIREYK